jgi:2-polyprenyl-3-methyl-5-hydroxy-6-metoxy-1,4-benzoquinol methylase
MDANSIERLVPDQLSATDVTGHETLQLHLERYEFAARHARSGRLLDMACGVGYGTRLVAERRPDITEAVGVDLSAAAIQHARARYPHPSVRFETGNALEYGDDAGFDTVISLETVEHVSDPERLIARLASLLSPGGTLVASVPTTPSTDVNPHHLHDFTEKSFRGMVTRHGLSEVSCLQQVQPYRLFASLRRTESRMQDLRPNLLRYYIGHPQAAVWRAYSTLRFGFTNRYLTAVWQRLR